MYLMYVDESGDCGKVNSPTKYYILSGIVVNEVDWPKLLDELVQFRRGIRKSHGLLMREEIHSAHFMSKRIKLRNSISPSMRMDILKKSLEWLGQRPYLSLISVRIDKAKSSDPFLEAWTALMQRFENTLKNQNFPNPAFKIDAGIIVADDTDVRKLTGLLRKLRKVNFIPNMSGMYAGGSRNIPIQYVIKDPICRRSANSYIIQMVDVVAYFVKQYYDPSKTIKKKGGKTWYSKLANIINPKATYRTTNYRIIEK